jgi:putative two-component system response regulator
LEAPVEANAVAAPSAQKERILATDDRPEMLRLVGRALSPHYACEFATTVAEARSKLAEDTFQLALCDIEMPDDSGLILAEEITSNHPETCVVLVTGVDDATVADRAFEFGVCGYLVKPFWPGQLLITAMNALRRHELELAEQDRNRRLLRRAQNEAVQLRDELAIAQQQAIEELRASRQETVERLALAIELHDAETGRHVNRMASIAAYLGRQLGLDRERTLLLRAAAPMHDVGTIAIPDEILRKPGPLTVTEREEMKRHTEVGHRILADSQSDLLRLAASIALTHHERFDGAGYPHGLRGYDIPLEGRIVAVADVFDALLSDRCYRPALPVKDAIKVIEKGRGTQFDPAVVNVLLQHQSEVLSLRG